MATSKSSRLSGLAQELDALALASSASLVMYEYTATAGQTVFTGPDNHGKVLNYIANNTLVYFNEGLLQIGVDYTPTSASVLTLTDPADVGSLVRMQAFGSFTIGDAYTKAETDDKLAAKVSQSSPTGAVKTTKGTTAERPVAPEVGDFRFNTTTKQFEGVSDLAKGWVPIGADSVPLFSVFWVPNRAAIPAGFVVADGQTLSRATYPDAWAGINAGNVPQNTDANWTANPLVRACYTIGDGSTTFRVPDYNGKSSGSLGAVFLRGDGVMSAGTDGVIQQDALQSHSHAINIAASTGAAMGYSAFNTGAGTQYGTSGASSAREASETRPLNATGCWCVKLFGAVINPGSVDAAQLATDMANLTAVVATSWKRTQTKGTVSGTPANPAGALFEQGSNANGSYMKFADGSMICRQMNTHTNIAASSGGSAVWNYPVVFAQLPTPSVSGGGVSGYGFLSNFGVDGYPTATNVPYSYINSHNVARDLYAALYAVGVWA